MKKTGLEIVNERAAKVVEFFDIPKPQKKRMFLTGIALGFLVLSWCVPDVDAGGKDISVTFCDQSANLCGFVGVDRKLYDWDGNILDSSGNIKRGFSSNGYKILTDSNSDPFTFYGAISGDALKAISFAKDGGWVRIMPNGELQECATNYGCWPTGQTNVVDAERGNLLPDSMAYVKSDGTSNLCPGSDNVKIWVSDVLGQNQGRATSFICKKSDGSYVSSGNIPNYVDPIGSKDITTYPSTQFIPGEIPRYIYVNSDDTLTGINITVKTGKWRNPRILTDNAICAVSLTDSKMKCWDSSGTIFKSPSNTSYNPNPAPPDIVTYPDGTECYNFSVPKLSSVSWMTPEFMFSTGTVATQVFTGGSNYGCTGWGQKCGDKIRTLNDDGAGNMDFLTLYNYDASSVVRTPSWRNPATATGPRSTLIADDFEPQILGIGSIRDNVKFAADVWQFTSVQNPGINVPWAFWISEGKGVNQVFATGGTATLVNANLTTSLTLFLQEFSVPPIGFRMGKSTEQESKTQCRIGNNACTWELRGTEYQCVSKIYNSYAGVCSVDSNGRCAPTITASGTVSEAVPLEGSNVTTDQYGNVISVTPGNSNVQGTTVNIDGVFDCADYDGFLDIFPCSLQVAKNIWQLVSDSVNQTDSAAKKVTDTMGAVGSGSTGSIDLSPVSPNGANLADDMFRGAWNNTWEPNEFNKWGYFALIGALNMMVIAIIFTIALINRK